MIRGIDVSSNDGWRNGRYGRSNTESAYSGSDFVIVKLTQGTTYTNPYFAKMLSRAESDKKLIGCYHYAAGGSAVAEARFFVNRAKPYIGRAMLVLDFESIQNKAWSDYGWCRRFVDEVHRITGVWCAIYIQASSRDKAANCADVCPLWLAGYPDYRNSWDVPNFRYGTSPWETYTLWQYTSGGGTDRDVAQLDRAGWLRIAGSTETASSAKKQQDTTDDVEEDMGVIVEPRKDGKPEGYQAYVADGKIVILTKPEQAAALAAIGVKTKIVTSEQMAALKQVMTVTSAKSDADKK